MLRQKLMCDAEPTLFTYNWLKGHEHPHPNFNTARQCRSFEAIKQYALDHALDGTGFVGGYCRLHLLNRDLQLDEEKRVLLRSRDNSNSPIISGKSH